MSWLGSGHQLSLRSDPAFPVRCHRLKTPSLSDLRRLWAELPGGAISTPFQTPEFLQAFQETHCRDGESSLSVAAFTGDDQADTPFMVLPLLKYRRGPIRVASLPDLGLADQNAPVLSPVAVLRAKQTAQAIQSFFESLEEVDLVDIGKVHEHVGEAENPLFLRQAGLAESSTLCLDLEDDADGAARARKSIYKKIRSKYRKLREAGVELVEARTPADRLAVFNCLAGQRQARFRQLGREDSLQRHERYSFYKCLATQDASHGPLACLSLKHGDETVAALMLLAAGAQATAVLVSIGDPKWHGFSPGMVLFAKAIEWARDRGCSRFSFGTGQQEYKQRFGGVEQETRRMLLPLNARGRLFVRAREAHRTAQELLQIAVGGNGVKA